VLTWLRELAATVGTFDRSALEPGYALRCTLGVAIPLVIATALGKPPAGVAAAIGAFIIGFTSLQGIYRTRLQAILAATFGMALTSFIGTVAAHNSAGLVAATAVAAYGCATIGQLGPAAATVAINSFVAFVLFSSQALTPEAALVQSVLVLCGGLIQAGLLIAVWPAAHSGVERAALAEVYENLAAYARAVASGVRALPPLTPFATARQVLADPQPFARSAERARFNRLLEDSEIIRKRLAAHAMMRAIPAGVAPRLETIAALLRGTRGDEAAESTEDAGGEDFAYYLRDATLAAEMLSTGRVRALQLLSKPKPGPYVENHIRWLSKDSLRFAIVLSIAMVLARHFSADRGYWIPMTAAIVLKPDFQTTFVRGVARIGGTLAGAVIATLALALVRGHPGFEVAGVLVAAAAAYLTFNPNYALFTVAITSFVVLVLGLRGLPGTTTIDARIFDTLVGGGLAMIGYLAMPSWEHRRTRALLANLLDAQGRLACAILRALAAPSEAAQLAIAPARNAVWQARTTAEESIDRARHEPHRPGSISVGRSLRILAVTQRIGLATLALETAIGVRVSPAASAAVGAFADALDERMAELAAALRESRRAAPGDRLASALVEAEAFLDAPEDSQAFILHRMRGYADALDRLARLVTGRLEPRSPLGRDMFP
jgi:uncharacterized membrane protein YccC